MKAAIVLTFLLSLTPAVQPNAEKDPHHHQTVKEIGDIKDRLKVLRDLIDGINEDSYQSGVTSTVLCDVADKFSKTFKCITSYDENTRTKADTVNFVRKFNTNPGVATGLSGLNFFFGADVEVAAQNVQKNNFQQLVKSDDLFAPLVVMSNSFAFPSKLQSGH